VLDKSRAGWPASIAAVGLALAAYPVGVECGFLTRADVVRVARQFMGRVPGFATAGGSQSRWRDHGDHSLDGFPEAVARKVHGRVSPHSEAARTGA
jgi:hypothetical protein